MASSSYAKPTKTLRVDPSSVGYSRNDSSVQLQYPSLLQEWDLVLQAGSESESSIQLAAKQLRESDVPVAFPTETVYGLGADATRSSAVRGIYQAKGRPSDNPLIVHIDSLAQLRTLLRASDVQSNSDDADIIPAIYLPLIDKFWPGPLTMLMPRPAGSALATEVTAGLDTFGVRMPSNIIALALIRLAGVPIAAPSANASTKPSPTAAEHVVHDLEGRIEFVVDGGPCEVGVESTVVDGLSNPPLILRPGGITAADLRSCPGWENVQTGYKDSAGTEAAPKAPGMKYRHYSPAAKVHLYEAEKADAPPAVAMLQCVSSSQKVGIIRTARWPLGLGIASRRHEGGTQDQDELCTTPGAQASNAVFGAVPKPVAHNLMDERLSIDTVIFDVSLGKDAKEVARGIFSALRELDLLNVDVCFVEGIDDTAGPIAAAVMNRLRKAAQIIV